jgi:2-polyprenyl-3-methyl-5-hydroxy-6-metoxy-1,4-benzoquinol methylase
MAPPGSYQQPDLVQIWDRVAETYAGIDLSAPDYKAYQEHLLELIGPPAGLSTCEVGCGSGTTSALLGGLGARVTLVDLSPKALATAREHFAAIGLAAGYCRQNGLSMGFKDGAFDVVWNGGVIEHFSDDGKIALIREMWRVTRPGGLLLIAVPNARDLPFILGKKLAQWRGKWIFGYEDDLNEARFRALARAAGVGAMEFHAHNPVVGWWFLPFGRSLTRRLGLDTAAWHSRKSRLGHVLTLAARKPAA